MSTLHLTPELTIYTVAELHPQWLAWLAETATPGTGAVAVEISAVNEVDAAGLQLLLSLTHTLTARGLRLQMLGNSGALETGLVALGLDGVMGQPRAREPVAAGALA